MHRPVRSATYRFFVLAAVLALAACGHHPFVAFTVGGSINGLSKSGLVLQNNGRDNLTVTANAAAFQFATPVAVGGDYDVTILTQPTGLTCSIGNGAGHHVAGDIVNVRIACSTVTLTIGGTVTGLTGSGLVLQNNGGDNLTVAANATAFEFATPVAYGSRYAVTVATQPLGQSCTLARASGTATAEVSGVALTCVPAQFVRFEGHNALLSSGRLAKDPRNGSPLYFVFVDNTNSGTADGSLQHPYPTLALAQANSRPTELIYVFPGDSTTGGMDAGMVLQTSQKFWGAGAAHLMQTSEGSIPLPASASSTPTITNTTGDGIILATDNEISGVVLSEPAGNGISGSDAGSVTIEATTIDRAQLDAIYLAYNSTSAPLVLQDLTLTDGALRGIVIDSAIPSSAPAMDVTLSNSVIRGFGTQSIDASFTNEVDARLTGNTIQGNVSASFLAFAGPATLSVSGNAFNDNTSISEAPLSISAGAGPLAAVIGSNTVSGNTAGAIRLVLAGTDSDISITGNTITHNGTGAIATLGAALLINPSSTTTGSCNLVLTNNTISDNDGPALFSFNGGFDDFQMTASDNTLSGNGGGGLIFANTANTFTLTATRNAISGGRDNAIATEGPTMTTAHITLSDNHLTGNTNSANGIVLSHDGSSLELTATNNDITGNEGSGILLYSPNPIANLTATIQNNTVGSNQNLGSNAASGIDLEQYTSMQADISGNTLSGNAGDAVFVGSTDPAPYVCMQMSGNSSDTGYTLSSGAGVFNLAPAHVQTVNIGTINLIGAITNVLSCPDAVPAPP